MDVILKWIGGGTVAAALVLAGIAIGGRATAENDMSEPAIETPTPVSQSVFAHGAIAAKAAADAKLLYTIRRVLPIRVGADDAPARAAIQAVHQIHAPAERVAGPLQERHDVVLADVLGGVGRDAARLRDDGERVAFVEYFQRRRRLEDDWRRWCGRWGERLDCACSHNNAVVAHQCAANAGCRLAARLCTARNAGTAALSRRQ